MKNILLVAAVFTGSKIYISQVGYLQLSSYTIPYVDRRSGKLLGSFIL